MGIVCHLNRNAPTDVNRKTQAGLVPHHHVDKVISFHCDVGTAPGQRQHRGEQVARRALEEETFPFDCHGTYTPVESPAKSSPPMKHITRLPYRNP